MNRKTPEGDGRIEDYEKNLKELETKLTSMAINELEAKGLTPKPIAPANRTIAQKYQNAREKVLNGLPGWKRRTVLDIESTNGNKDDRIFVEFVKSIIELAEADPVV